ncbi:spike base protein, RCAP_Rcc01079 family [Ketogulonicigenium vulgare]|uniref:spike base protein, RCAP_Rcc01079 family n=1 Tax=Ketogulonicigenium vulgare TaxID=92945 RepID=UPI003B5C30F1
MDSPASNAASIAPLHTDDLPHVPRALYALGEGNVRVRMRGGGDPVVLPILAGSPAGCA